MYKLFRKHDGSLAQLEEHLVYTERVGSSNLSTPTNKKKPPLWRFFLIGEMKRENTREREFDKEEQARREYRRSCDDEAAERLPNNSPIR